MQEVAARSLSASKCPRHAGTGGKPFDGTHLCQARCAPTAHEACHIGKVGRREVQERRLLLLAQALDDEPGGCRRKGSRCATKVGNAYIAVRLACYRDECPRLHAPVVARLGEVRVALAAAACPAAAARERRDERVLAAVHDAAAQLGKLRRVVRRHLQRIVGRG